MFKWLQSWKKLHLTQLRFFKAFLKSGHLQPLEVAAFFKLKDLKYCNLNVNFTGFGSFSSRLLVRFILQRLLP